MKLNVQELSYAERRELLKALLKTRAEYDQEWVAELARRSREMAAGKKVSQEDVLKRCGLAR